MYIAQMKSSNVQTKQSKHPRLDPLIQEIVHTRKSQKFTQSQLAEMSGVARRTIVLIESGGDCTLSTLRRITTALSLEISVYKPQLPNLDDLTRENEKLFSSQHSFKGMNQGDSNA